MCGVSLSVEPFEELRRKALQSVKRSISESYKEEQNSLMQSINAYNELMRSYNLYFERLSEWFGIYNPHVEISNPRVLTSLALLLSSEKDPDKEAVSSIISDEAKAQQIADALMQSKTREISAEERAALMNFANAGKGMEESIIAISSYIDSASRRIMPNVSKLIDERIAAELLQKAGSLEKLAKMPASTVQLLGAEKALFKHIKFGSRPPKYGILFRLPEIASAPKDYKGRMARIYATKICIAARADFYTKRDISERLLADLKAAIESAKERPKTSQPSSYRNRNGQGGNWRNRRQGGALRGGKGRNEFRGHGKRPGRPWPRKNQ